MKDMRNILLLIFITITMAFVTGYYALFIQGNLVVTNEDIAQIKNAKKEFRINHSPELIINFNSLYSSREHLELIKPIAHLGARGVLSSNVLYSSNENCFKDIYNITDSSNYEKVILWEEYRCGRRKRLPKVFFSSPPFVHPSGQSYAYLAYVNNQAPYNTRKWIEKNFQYFHLSEFKRIQMTKSLPSFFKVLGQLDEDVLTGVIKGVNNLITNDYYLEKNRDIFVFFDLEYKIYKTSDFLSYIEKTPYVVKKYKKDKRCFFKDGNLCWNFNVVHLIGLTSKRNIFVFTGSLLIIILLIHLLYTKLRNQRLEDNRRRLALQVLSHEFRTPVTSLLLLAEEAQQKFKNSDEESQELILRLSSDIHRLHRLVEASRNYLKLDQAKSLITFNPRLVESMNEFLSYVLSPYSDDIEIIPLVEDRGFVLDEYWFSICLKNLVENAINHGEKPIKVRTTVTNNKNLKIEVEDAGECDFESLANLTQEFVKGKKSEGSGLGLNIVKKVLADMKAEFSFNKKPTVFTILLKDKK